MAIYVKTMSRLHLGFMDLNGDLGRRYGSIGVTLSDPCTELTIGKSKYLNIQNASDELEHRISKYVRIFSDHFKTDPYVSVYVHKSIPEHKGLGSGSQLALAVSTALAKIYDLKISLWDQARLMDRGQRSSIGIQSFQKGGLIIDSGKELDPHGIPMINPPELLFRYDFPHEWKFVVVVPDEKQGLSGAQEKKAIGQLKPSKTISEKICRIVMMQMLPSFMSRDIAKFGDALSVIDKLTGLFFKPVQGGIYCEDQSYGLTDHFLASGAYGTGQSSWGPAIYGLTLADEAEQVAGKMRFYLQQKYISGSVLIASACNKGARILKVEDSRFEKHKKSSILPVVLNKDGFVGNTSSSSVARCMGS